MPRPGNFELVAITPVTWNDPSIAIAASRAGELGIFDVSLTRDPASAKAAFAKLNNFAPIPWGLRICGNQSALCLEACAIARDKKLGVLVITTDDIPARDALASIVSTFKSHGCRVMLEVKCAEEVSLGHLVGADGFLVKGNEAGGWVSGETTFVLLQRVLNATYLPVWAHGGIGLHTAAGCFAAGAAGAVLDAQFWLTRECNLPGAVRSVVARMDGSETVVLKNALRILNGRGSNLVVQTVSRAEQVAGERGSPEWRDWQASVESRVGWGSHYDNIWFVGQDAAFAAPLADHYHTVGGVLAAIRNSIRDHIRAVRSLNPLGQSSPLAKSHRTRFPIVQGPMTRVSDRPAFAERVADAGALPFLALALMPEPEVEQLLKDAFSTIGDRPWGVGILGFVPEELRREQLAAIQRIPPPFALIAGGRPEQVRALEARRITTYVHVPSPGLLRMFLADGAKRFVFEGRECGGHVGPRSSFVLWEQMIGVLLEYVVEHPGADGLHVLFAGGIHDALSAAMVASMSACLAEKGVRVGALVGTAYLFTTEAVSTGAIVEGFQNVALDCAGTSLIETGPGHLIRCANTPYVDAFNHRRKLLLTEGLSPQEVRERLEHLNLGRLRIAAKATARAEIKDAEQKLRSVDSGEQRLDGLYMLGEIASLRNSRVTLNGLHEEISIGSSQHLDKISAPEARKEVRRKETPLNIAIIGMACLLPKAPDLNSYWENILDKVDAITEIPVDRFDWRRYYDVNRHVPDRIYSKWGGFLDPVAVDPIHYGIPPNTISSIEPLQLLTLHVVETALEDAGYRKRPFNRARTAVILGAGGGIADLGHQYAFRSALPMYLDGISAANVPHLPEWTEDSFAGILLNVAAGRVANRFDLGGANYVVDAACASSLAAIYLAARELESGESDMVITGGVDTVQNPFGYLCFAKTQALSPTGRCRTFDANADGIAISEGVAVVILKRLADAERDGDQIYAVIKGIGGSSDGRDKGLTAPRPEGQMRALCRAYSKAGFQPSTVGLIEAHGTGTSAGDQAEVESLTRVFGAAGSVPQSCALGSVKSMIGHTKCAAGVAGLIKAALALDRKVLPPTMHVQKPNPKIDFPNSPFYVNAETRPWISRSKENPRRAGVSAFGFGGTNFHAVLEEYSGNFLESPPARRERWPAELMLWIGDERAEIVAELQNLRSQLEGRASPRLVDLSFTLWERARYRLEVGSDRSLRLALVACSKSDLLTKIRGALISLTNPAETTAESDDFYLSGPPYDSGEPKVALLFPGQGSQHPDMLKDLAIQFKDMQDVLERADQVLADSFSRPLSSFIYPVPRFSREDEMAAAAELTETRVAQPALGSVELGLARLLRRCGVNPHATAGHSYGEYVALCVAGALSEESLFTLSEARGRFIADQARHNGGAMAAVSCPAYTADEILQGMPDVWVANRNSPRQTILSASEQRLQDARCLFDARKIAFHPIAVSCAFHSPLVAQAKGALVDFLRSIEIQSPRIPVYSNTTAGRYPEDPHEIREILGEHLVRPVEFQSEIEAMYEEGVRIFLEAGPRGVMSSLVEQTLANRQHVAIRCDVNNRSGLTQFQHVLARLAIAGINVNLSPIFEGRAIRPLRLEQLAETVATRRHMWLITGGKARPATEVFTGGEPAAPVPVQLGSGKCELSNDVPTPQSDLPRTTPTPASNKFALPHAVEPGSAQAMLQFQQLMQQFLHTQQAVMGTYLATRAPSLSSVPEDSTAVQQTVPPAPAPLQTVPSSRDPSPGHPARRETDPEDLRRLVLQVVSDRTGYPPEILQWDADIEGDLGIDSIKRIEIVGELERIAGYRGGEKASGLAVAKTLRLLADALIGGDILKRAQEPADSHQPRDQPTSAPVETVPTVPQQIPRFALRGVEAPANPVNPDFLAGKRFLVTDDGSETAPLLCGSLQACGAAPILIGRIPLEQSAIPSVRSDLADFSAVQMLISQIRRDYGVIDGIIHLLPLSGEMEVSTPETCLRKLRTDVKTLFTLAQAASSDLMQSGWVLAATRFQGLSGPLFEGCAWNASCGVAGFVKTLSLEWEATQCRSVAFASGDSAARISSALIEELLIRESSSEVARVGSVRMKPQPCRSQLLENKTASLALDCDSVVLLIGGARGITAEIAVELAARYQPLLILVGRTEAPPTEEATETAGIEEPRLVKLALIERARTAGLQPTPSVVEAEYQQLLREREVRRNLNRMRQAGSRVVMLPADVRDEAALRTRIEQIYSTYERLDGVIHGAAVIEDKLVEDKKLDSFERVFETKIAPMAAVLASIRPESLRFFILFSSVAGLFGNRGQADYGAANEALNELALQIDRSWPGRVLSLNWGPWDGGLASPELRHRFVERGVQIIGLREGSRAFVRELESAPKGDCIVLLGGGPWEEPRSVPAFSNPVAGPLLKIETTKIAAHNGFYEMNFMLDSKRHLYLRDHILDGHPVLPAAMALELLAEFVKHQVGTKIVGADDFRVLAGVIVGNGECQLKVRMSRSHGMFGDGERQTVSAELVDGETGQPRYRSSIILAESPAPPTVDALNLGALLPFRFTVRDAYERWLFHGPCFQAIETIEGMNDQGLVAMLRQIDPSQCLRSGSGEWLIDPILADAAFQLAILWVREHADLTPLPARFKKFRRFGTPQGQIRCELEAELRNSTLLRTQITMRSRDSSFIAIFQDMDFTCSRELNRLAMKSMMEAV